MLFASKQNVIEAEQFTGDIESAGRILQMLGALAREDVTRAYFVWKENPSDIVQGFRLHTKSNKGGVALFVMPTDYVCVMPGGLAAIVVEHIFDATYTLAADDEPERGTLNEDGTKCYSSVWRTFRPHMYDKIGICKRCGSTRRCNEEPHTSS
jgi:hypothetical protein